MVYDGEATFVPIEGTSMSYAKNTSVPVIKVSDNNYYCVEAGVWFKAPTPQGPWRVADTVPPEIYTIPPSSPIYYVTYVKVYGSSPDVVYVGYTPGYYGTVVSSNTTTVVYGTGWYYPPYISPTVWYGWPYTYGVGAGFTWTTTTGWSFGFGYGYAYYPWYYPWWGPMGYYGYGWYPYYGWGAWGGAAVANVYGVWGNTAYSRTGAAWANPYTGNYGAATPRLVLQHADRSLDGCWTWVLTPTSTPATQLDIAVARPTIPIPASLPVAEQAYAGNIYSGQGTAGRGGFAYNTNTNAGVAAGKNNVYAGKDGTVYSTTGIAAIGRATAAADGNRPPSRMPTFSASSRCARKGRNGPRRSTPWAAMAAEWVAPEWVVVEAADVNRELPLICCGTRARHQPGNSCLYHAYDSDHVKFKLLLVTAACNLPHAVLRRRESLWLTLKIHSHISELEGGQRQIVLGES